MLRFRAIALALATAFIATAGIVLMPLTAATDTEPVYWQRSNVGLPSTDVEALATTPATVSTTMLYAGTWGKGIARSSDHGRTWMTATAGITLPFYVNSALAVNPVTPTTVYAGGYYGGGVYRSEDAGNHWQQALPDASVRALAVHPVTPTLVFAGDREAGLYRSSDGGDTWHHITPTTGLTRTRIPALTIADHPSGTIYAGADEYVFRSDDAGAGWRLAGVLSSTVQSLMVHPITPSLVYAGSINHGLFRSADGGDTWEQVRAGIPDTAWVTSLAATPATVTPTTLYAGTWGGEVYRSHDEGTTWTSLDHIGTVYALAVHPTAPNVIYAGTTSAGVLRGSTLDHLTIESVTSPQCVNQSFPVTITARDALGFPLTGESNATLATMEDTILARTLAQGYAGTATLTDTSSTITPTDVMLSDGMATPAVMIRAAGDVVITATLADGPAVRSEPFAVTWPYKLNLPLIAGD